MAPASSTGCTGTDDYKVSRRAPRFGFGALGASKAYRSFDASWWLLPGFEAGSVFAPLVIAVVGGLEPGGDDKRVVGKCIAVGEKDFFGLGSMSTASPRRTSTFSGA